MGYNTDSALIESSNCVIVYFKSVSYAKILSCPVMYALKTKLNPHEVIIVYLRQKLDYIISETVRPRCNYQPAYTRVIYYLVVFLSKNVYRRIRVSKALKVRKVCGIRPFVLKKLNLFTDGGG